ncbi:MAG: EAL domain-containing protein [Azoarcus sp.]|jgi:diguanylate cyclase (GGDEF)-like protein|nr:EAL domain-containing protein [Azoarcus sp.]
MDFWLKLSVRVRLILLFVAIKVVPLVLLLWIAWSQTRATANHLGEQIGGLVETADRAILKVGDMAIDDAVNALDAHARDEIERLTTDTARRVADFLYARDVDILHAATLAPDKAAYRNFVDQRRRNLIRHGKWRLSEDGEDWEPETTPAADDYVAQPGSRDNATSFHYRAPTEFNAESVPLYLEMTFIGRDGKEKLKVTTSPEHSAELKDVSQRRNTYARAETYFADLERLKPGEIYVSEVIGAYVGSQIIGKFTPRAAEERGIAFEPEKHAYAGKENPVGKRFRGIMRWATPVTKNGKITGWVTLALNHDHLMSFTDHIVPSDERYRDINDAFDGNYAFIWDYKGRSIVHPRHHSIVGYDQDGEPYIPWLEDRIYEDWRQSGKSWPEYMQTAPTFVDQLQSRKPARELTERGDVGLDCRWLNFAPQCTGWYNLADQGGSGSFLILWSGLYKLTTTAAIPYYTGRYSPEAAGNKRGFGIVTVGANVDDFHRDANESKERLDGIIKAVNDEMRRHGDAASRMLHDDLAQAASRLTVSTAILIVAVIIIAIWMASFLTKKIGWLDDGFNRYRLGEKDFRFHYKYEDEITSLAGTFNEMAEALNKNVTELEKEILVRTRAEAELRDMRDNLEKIVDVRTRELSETNRQLSEEICIRRAAEEKAQYLAGHDPLTGLANRMLFNEQLQKAVSQSGRSGKHGALLFFDLDQFKQVNDTLGHTVGDMLLGHMGNVLQERVRRMDTAARLGGDEFAVIMNGIDRPEQAAILAQDILDRLRAPVMLAGNKMNINVSIGIATFLSDKKDQDPEEIIKNADMAMYASKTAGGMRYKFFEEKIQEKLFTSIRLEKALRVALDERQFIPYFQPLYCTSTHRVLYLEVLARWMHPEKGMLLPGEFMEAAEHCGVCREIDFHILRMACSHVREWLDEGLFSGRISFNISPRHFEQSGFIARVQAILNAYRVNTQYVAFEISEYTLLRNSTQTVTMIRELREMGIEIVIDRLVVERSALENLFEYPVDAVKIDHFFTSRIGDVKVNSTIAAISVVAHSMGMRLIAEGVENETQWDYFQTLRCNIIQGYKHARPMNAEDTRAYLEQGRGNAPKT